MPIQNPIWPNPGISDNLSGAPNFYSIGPTFLLPLNRADLGLYLNLWAILSWQHHLPITSNPEPLAAPLWGDIFPQYPPNPQYTKNGPARNLYSCLETTLLSLWWGKNTAISSRVLTGKRYLPQTLFGAEPPLSEKEWGPLL